MWRDGEKEGYVRLLSTELLIASVGLYAGEVTDRVYAEEVLVNSLWLGLFLITIRHQLILTVALVVMDYTAYIVVNLSMFSDPRTLCQHSINLFQVNFILLLTPG
jgi:hypothetical protein